MSGALWALAAGAGFGLFQSLNRQAVRGMDVYVATFFQLPVSKMIGRVDIPHTHTYLKDFGRALVILGERAEADGQVWHVPNDQPRITQGEMLKMFAEEAGVKMRMTSVGSGMLRLVGLFSPPAKELVEMMYEFDQPFIVDSSKFEQAFGMRATPMREAIKETVAWFKSHPEKR